MAKVHSGNEILLKISTSWVRCTNVTDRRQTDGFVIATERNITCNKLFYHRPYYNWPCRALVGLPLCTSSYVTVQFFSGKYCYHDDDKLTSAAAIGRMRLWLRPEDVIFGFYAVLIVYKRRIWPITKRVPVLNVNMHDDSTFITQLNRWRLFRNMAVFSCRRTLLDSTMRHIW